MKLRLFIYGSCGSGKTSFFRQLIQGNGIQFAANSRLAKFMSSSISPTGQVIPTTAGIDGLEIKLDRDSYIISDWKGELLSASVNELATGNLRWFSRNQNLIANQILSCDAILFFFDPSAQSAVDSIRSSEQIQKHHCEELLRAKQIIDFVLRTRQNKFTPILFVLTHNDLLDVIPQLNEKTERWVDAVDKYLRESYETILGGHYPNSLICREQLFHYVSTIRESKQPRKVVSASQVGATPTVKVDAMNWVESFPFAVDLANILRQIPKHVNLIAIFDRKDRKRYRSIVISFAICLCLVFFVPIIISMPRVQSFISSLQKMVLPIGGRIPQLQMLLNGGGSQDSDETFNLKALDNAAELDDKNAVNVNESLNILMRKLNRLEDANQQNSDDYKNLFVQWSEAMQKVERIFDMNKFENIRVKLDLFSVILSKLTDSSSRVTPQLDGVLKKFWNLYREMLISELADEIQINRDAGSTGKQQLEILCSRMERFFIEINNSKVRGSSFTFKLENSVSLKETNPKEQLKQDIRKSFKACENFLANYPVEIRLKEISYSSEIGIDRDFARRLKISGVDGNPIYVDLTISSGYRNDKVCQFLPSKDRVMVLLNFDSSLQISLEQMHKGNASLIKDKTNDAKINNDAEQKKVEQDNQQSLEIVSGWQEFVTWHIEPQSNKKSFECVGIKFYLQFENDTNTRYACEGEGMKIHLEIKRARTVPDLLWQIINRAVP
ncbi:MAG: GTPase domain-containing protein [Planctomycetaceae bacterium]|jgi:hypothetical protein|nr:GTPase domain-containing protein [Planctomycetaceae bacterium]